MLSKAVETGLLLQHITSLLAKQVDQMLQSELEIGYSQFKIMEVIQGRPSIQQRDIALLLVQTEASVSRQIKLLIKLGMLTNTKDPINNKSRYSQLTEQGQLITNKAIAYLDEYYEAVFSNLSERDIKNLSKQLSFIGPKAV